MKYFSFFACVALILAACSKHSSSVKSADPAIHIITGHLRYASISYDGPGLWYDIDSSSRSVLDGGDSVLLLSDGQGGFIQDGEDIAHRYQAILDSHTQFAFRYTGKEGCQVRISNVCHSQAIVDTISFSVIP